MAGFLAAHGYDPGPTQRPYSAGGISGVLAAFPAVGVLWWFGSLEVEAEILQLSVPATLALGWTAMAAAGAAYARLFGRAANIRRGSWLFGMAFGFALWAAGAVLVLPLLSGGEMPGGPPAIGVFLSLLVWGAGVGCTVPLIHPYLQQRPENVSGIQRIGPAAGTTRARTRTRAGDRRKR